MEDPLNIPPQPSNPYNPGLGEPVPNSTGVLVLGILSIVFCIFYGFIGLTLGIVALSLAAKGKSSYEAEPHRYNLQSWNSLKAGRICAIVGTSLSALYLVFVIIFIALIGFSGRNHMNWDNLFK